MSQRFTDLVAMLQINLSRRCSLQIQKYPRLGNKQQAGGCAEQVQGSGADTLRFTPLS